MRYRSLIIPLLTTLAGVVLLVSLGKWQLDRRDWKLGIIERIETRVGGEPVSLNMAHELWRKDQDIDYYRVLLVGRFLHEHERYFYTISQGQPGWRVITPLETGKGDVVLVDRGFVTEPVRDPAARPQGQLEGTVELIGLARGSEQKAPFTPENEPDANRWFWRDIPGLAASLPGGLAERAAPFVVEVEAAPVPGGWPRGGVTRLQIPNKHLEYALTWFGLALALLVVFIVYARNRLIAPPPDTDHAEIAERKSSV